MFTYKELLKKGENELLASDISDAAIDAWYLFEYVTDMSRASFFIRRNEEIPEEQANAYIEVIEKRKKRIPLQHITGKQEFMGLDFFVNENVLVPRQDTECLVENVISYANDKKILDMCTGSGCIIISVKKFVQTAECTGADISEKALETALKNADLNNVPVSFIKSDMFENISEKYDIIVSNPPYIKACEIEGLMDDVKLYEPHVALDGGEDGLIFYRRIIEESRLTLNENGILAFEIGHDQGLDVRILMEEAGFSNVKLVKDLAGLDRVLLGYFKY